MLKVHENGGRTTTVSGDLADTWGYAAELRRSEEALTFEAYKQKGRPPGEVFIPRKVLEF